jgi:Zn-dependent alcohol dehydrogenase
LVPERKIGSRAWFWYRAGPSYRDDLMRSERINDAFDLMHQGKSIRSVIEY